MNVFRPVKPETSYTTAVVAAAPLAVVTAHVGTFAAVAFAPAENDRLPKAVPAVAAVNVTVVEPATAVAVEPVIELIAAANAVASPDWLPVCV